VLRDTTSRGLCVRVWHMYVYYYRTYEKAVSGGGRGGKRRTCAKGPYQRGLYVRVWPPLDFGLWSFRFPPVLVRTGRLWTLEFSPHTSERRGVRALFFCTRTSEGPHFLYTEIRTFSGNRRPILWSTPRPVP